MVAPDKADGFALVAEIRVPHQRAVAEDPQIAARQAFEEQSEFHAWGLVSQANCTLHYKIRLEKP
jgi:hypothetical protein